QVAVYSALPVLKYPAAFSSRAAEGIRTNIGVVFDAVALKNPYPSSYLNESAWNQLILKSFFMDKPIRDIIGWQERANKNLAYMLFDYAQERRSAKRTIHPDLWRLVGPFLDPVLVRIMITFLPSAEILEKQAAALACWESQLPAALALLEKFPELKQGIQDKNLTWEDLGKNKN
ncbi:MAG: EboA domain-containing protein, partial [Chitinophagaceae bacterium]